MKKKKLLGITLSCVLAFGSIMVPVSADTDNNRMAVMAEDDSISTITLKDGTVITYDSSKFKIDESGCLKKYKGSDAEVVIPEGVTSIGEGAFYECIGLESITIPEGVTSIGEGAFYECIGLESITIPESVANIGVLRFLEQHGWLQSSKKIH